MTHSVVRAGNNAARLDGKAPLNRLEPSFLMEKEGRQRRSRSGRLLRVSITEYAHGGELGVHGADGEGSTQLIALYGSDWQGRVLGLGKQ